MNKKIFADFTWILMGKIASLAASILLIKILTQHLEFAEYSKLILGLTIWNFINQVNIGAAGHGIGRVYIEAVQKNQYKSFRIALRYIGEKILHIYIFLLLIVGLLSYLFNTEWLGFGIAIIVYSAIYGINDISSGLHNLAQNRKESNINIIIENSVKIIIIYILSKYFRIDALLVVLIYLTSSIASFSYLSSKKESLYLQIEEKNEDSRKYSDLIKQFWISASAWGIFVWVQQASDKWVLKLFHGDDAVAQYSVIYQIAYTPFLMIVGIAMTLLIPIIYKSTGSKIINQMLIFISLICGLALFANFLVTDEFYSLIINPKYLREIEYIPHLLIAASLFQAGEVISSKLMRDNRSSDILKVKIFSATVCLMTHAYGAYAHGVKGVVISMLLFGIIYFSIFSFFALNRKNQKNDDVN